LPGVRPRQDDPVQDSGLDRHEWETEWRETEWRVADAPADALPELDALVARMLETRGPAADPPAGAVDSEAEIVLQLREVATSRAAWGRASPWAVRRGLRRDGLP